jgi:hypothetical protein
MIWIIIIIAYLVLSAIGRNIEETRALREDLAEAARLNRNRAKEEEEAHRDWLCREYGLNR